MSSMSSHKRRGSPVKPDRFMKVSAENSPVPSPSTSIREEVDDMADGSTAKPDSDSSSNEEDSNDEYDQDAIEEQVLNANPD
jgi:hypothetical protein